MNLLSVIVFMALVVNLESSSSSEWSTVFYNPPSGDAIFEKRMLRHPKPFIQEVKQYFIGRFEEMSKIRDIHAENKPVVVTGAKGVGKSELALHYASVYHTVNNADVYWLDCSSVGDMLIAIYNLASDFGILVKKNTSDVFLDDMFSFLQNSSSLFIFDNARTNNTFIFSLSAILHKYNQVRILITSSELRWNQSHYSILKLDSFTKQEALQFIKAKLDTNLDLNLKLKEKYSSHFPEDLEYIPLVLENATDFIIQQPDYKLKEEAWLIDEIVNRLRLSSDLRVDEDLEFIINKEVAKENIHACVKNSIENVTSPEWTQKQYQRLSKYNKKKTGDEWP